MTTEETTTTTYVDSLIARSRAALKEIESLSQRKVDELAAAIVYTLSRPELARELAEQSIEEAHLGRLESKIAKLTNKMPAVLYDILPTKTVGIVEEIPEKGIVKVAKPLGVIAAIIPATNPGATPEFKGVLALRGRNTVIFCPHPATRHTSLRVVNIMRDILKKNGVPEDVFICVDQPSIPITTEVMRQSDITMATGGAGLVKAAYSSGKPAYGVGAGNAVIIIDETADLKDAAAKIAVSKVNDWASGCSAENSLLIHESVYDQMVAELKAQGGYLASSQEKDRLEAVMWPDGNHLGRQHVARPASTIAELADITIDEQDQFIMVEETGYGTGYNFSREKLSVVMTLYKYRDFDKAIEMINTIQRNSGFGHSCGIHSFNEEHIRQLALQTYTTKVIVRQGHSISNSGNWHNGLANTFSLGCGTWGGNIVSENITQKHYINTTWVAYPIDRRPATEEEIYGDLLKNVKL